MRYPPVLIVLTFGCILIVIITIQNSEIIRTNTEIRTYSSAPQNQVEIKTVKNQIIHDANNYEMPDGTLCPIKPIEKLKEFFDYLQKPLYHCGKPRKFGGEARRNYEDGDKWLCLDEIYAIKRNNCRVLSFGINYEWSFDDAIDKFGCKVYAFDPTMSKSEDNFFRSPNIQFFKLGISKKKGKLKIGKVDTYSGILEMLKIEDKDIDYVKMDIEKSEIEVFEDWFYATPEKVYKIKQIGMEIHPGKFPKNSMQITVIVKKFYKYFQILECFGFELSFSNRNIIGLNPYDWNGTPQSSCYELVWINPSTKWT